MSEIKVSKLTNRAGTGAPDFSQGVKISGTASTLLAPTRTESATEPESPSNGDTWYDTANDTYDVYINDEWKRFIGEGGGSWVITDISSVSYDSVSKSVSSQDSAMGGVAFSSDGTKMYTAGYTNDKIYQYNLSTAWDLSTATYSTASPGVQNQETFPMGIQFNTDGTKAYVTGIILDSVHQYSLSTAWDISTMSYDGKSLSITSQGYNPADCTFNSDGTKIYVGSRSGDAVYEYSLSTAFDVSTATYGATLSISSQSGSVRNVQFSADGTKVYVSAEDSEDIYQYSCSTAYDLSTASYDSKSFAQSQTTALTGMFISGDGTKMYISGGNVIYQYSTGL